MPLTHKDITEIKRVLDDRYVLQSECDTTQQKINSKFANDDKRIELVLTEVKQSREENKKGLKFNNWLSAAILSALIAAVVAFYFFFA